jgi:hypothetical protein
MANSLFADVALRNCLLQCKRGLNYKNPGRLEVIRQSKYVTFQLAEIAVPR